MSACPIDNASTAEEDFNKLSLANQLARQPTFESYHECEDCGDEIPEARRRFSKGITRCVSCQSIVDIKNKGVIRK